MALPRGDRGGREEEGYLEVANGAGAPNGETEEGATKREAGGG